MLIKYYCCGDEQSVSENPLGLGYLVANAKGHRAEIVKHPLDLRGADVIGLSALADGMAEAVEVARGFSTYPVILGGQGALWPGAASLKMFNVKKWAFPHFDLIVRGEGEAAVNGMLSPGAMNTSPPGYDSAVVQCDAMPIDNIKPPLLGHCESIVPILTSRGCPHNCSYCSSSSFWGKPRYHSVGYLMDYIRFLGKRYPNCCELRILDDNFLHDKERFDDLFAYWMSHNLQHRWRLQGFARSDDVNFYAAGAMKAMGFRSIRFGAETASDRLLKELGKTTTAADHQRCIDACNEAGLPVTMSLMQYVPGETVEDRRITAEFLLKNKNKVKVQGNYRFVPYPGTKYYAGEDILEGNWKVRG